MSHSLYFIFVKQKTLRLFLSNKNIKTMYITIHEGFFINNGIECAVDFATNDIKVHKKFDSAMKYHQKFLEEFFNKYGESITNSPQIVCDGKNMIMTEFIIVTEKGSRHRILLITIKKNYED